MLYKGKNCETYSFNGSTSHEVHKKLADAVGDRNVLHVDTKVTRDIYYLTAYVEATPVGKIQLVEG